MTKLAIALIPLASISERTASPEKTPEQRRLELAFARVALLARELGDLAAGEGVVADLPPELQDRVTTLATNGFFYVYPLVTLLHAASSERPAPST